MACPLLFYPWIGEYCTCIRDQRFVRKPSAGNNIVYYHIPKIILCVSPCVRTVIFQHCADIHQINNHVDVVIWINTVDIIAATTGIILVFPCQQTCCCERVFRFWEFWKRELPPSQSVNGYSLEQCISSQRQERDYTLSNVFPLNPGINEQSPFVTNQMCVIPCQ